LNNTARILTRFGTNGAPRASKSDFNSEKKNDSLIGFQNVIDNAPFIEENPGVAALKDLLIGVPAVIVATGPSLTRTIQHLKMTKDKAVIIAADASLNILLENGIEPHFVVSLERDQGCMPFFEAASKFGKIPTHLVAYPLVPKEVLNAFNGLKWVVYRDYGYFHYLQEQAPRGIIPSSSSVTHLGARFAAHLGCDPICLVGQDLAFDPDTLQSHPEGIAYEGWSAARTLEEVESKAQSGNEKMLWVEGNIRTSSSHTFGVFQLDQRIFVGSHADAKAFSPIVRRAVPRIPNIPWKAFAEVSKGWDVQANLFEEIQAKHEDVVRAAKSIDWKPIRKFIEEMNVKLNSLHQHSEQFKNEASKLDDKTKIEVLHMLRTTQTGLIGDTRFVCSFCKTAAESFSISKINGTSLLAKAPTISLGR